MVVIATGATVCRLLGRFAVGLSLTKKSSCGGGASFKDPFAAWWHGTELREAEPDFDDGECEEA